MSKSADTPDDHESVNAAQPVASFQIGDRLDVRTRDQLGNWSICQVLEVLVLSGNNKQCIQIHYEGFPRKYDEWIQPTKDRNECDVYDEWYTKHLAMPAWRRRRDSRTLFPPREYAALHTYTPQMIYLPRLKQLKQNNNSNVLYFTKHSLSGDRDTLQRYLVITNSISDEDQMDVDLYPVVDHDTQPQAHAQLVPFAHNEGFSPVNQGNILGATDADRHILYMVGGKYGVFAKLNLLTAEWDVLCTGKKTDLQTLKPPCLWNPTMFWLDNGNELHLFGHVVPTQLPAPRVGQMQQPRGRHYKYDKSENRFLLVHNASQSGYKHLEYGKVVYMARLQKCFCFGPSGDIHCCSDFVNWTWQKMELMLPGDRDAKYTVVKAYETLIFVFFLLHNDRAICILDCDRLHWIKSHKKCPTMHMRTIPKIVDTCDGWLHFFGGHKYQFRVMIDDLIPQTLHEACEQRKELLIAGYARKYKWFDQLGHDVFVLLKRFYPKFDV